jgi:hypothetical protein
MAKPPLQFIRPARPEAQREQQHDLRPAPAPAIDLDSPEVQAFSLRGRVAASPPIEGELQEGIDARASVTGSPAPTFGAEPSLREEPVVDDPWRHVAVKIPAVSGQKLSEIADLRCSKRTRVALELLQGPLRELARAHRAGEYPSLRRITSGVSRSGVSLILPQDLADDLHYIVDARSAVKAQILARLLVPEIDALYLKEVLRRQ